MNSKGVDIPFIIVSGTFGEELAVEAMKVGAHDYVMKNNLKCLEPGRDITERKRAEDTLQQLYDETLKISKIKSNLLTIASHELKTPLTPILGWVELFNKRLATGVSENYSLK